MAKKAKPGVAATPPSPRMAHMGNEWDRYVPLEHLSGDQRQAMERRKRHRLVRYWCYRFKTELEIPETIEKGPEHLPGFQEFWLEQKPLYLISPRGTRVDVPAHMKGKTIGELGGYAVFSELWDVDADLNPYLRHASVLHEWNTTLMRVVPVLGEH